MDLSRRSLLTTGLVLTGSTIVPSAARAQAGRVAPHLRTGIRRTSTRC